MINATEAEKKLGTGGKAEKKMRLSEGRGKWRREVQ